MTASYQIKYEFKDDPFNRRAFLFASRVLRTATIFCLFSLIPWFRTSSGSMLFVDGLLFGTVITAMLPILPINYRLRIYEDRLTAEYWGATRTIYKHELRTVKERSETMSRPPALVLSKYGWLGSRYVSCIWIPRESAHYDEIRNLVIEWQRDAVGPSL
jgi:hypothetical protein